jgi:hypothetical protein
MTTVTMPATKPTIATELFVVLGSLSFMPLFSLCEIRRLPALAMWPGERQPCFFADSIAKKDRQECLSYHATA